jgi:ubiquinone/menaquinone biosynthesis C-methylase UbiE
MEHFSGTEISLILREFKRVLKPGGRLVLFWPPEFGLSVTFLKVVHFILNVILKKNILLHPPEITRVRSRGQIERFMQQGGFKLTQFQFGISDLFTYVVVVAEHA